MQPDELNSEAQRSTPRMGDEEEKVISTFEEAFQQIKEATGVTDVQVWMWKEKDCSHQLCIHAHMDGCFDNRFSFLGDSGALYLPERDTPTSAEAEGRE